MRSLHPQVSAGLNEIFGRFVRTDRVERTLYSHDVGDLPKVIAPIVPSGIAGRGGATPGRSPGCGAAGSGTARRRSRRATGHVDLGLRRRASDPGCDCRRHVRYGRDAGGRRGRADRPRAAGHHLGATADQASEAGSGPALVPVLGPLLDSRGLAGPRRRRARFLRTRTVQGKRGHGPRRAAGRRSTRLQGLRTPTTRGRR